MTRIIALAGVAALLSGTVAFAQAPPPPPGVLERGDVRVDVKCADDDTTKACADVTLQMLEKLGTFRP
ncbi:hypothetical protein [Methylobacterium oryzae]|uniref:hypothetical protein n=1 Tax=Methylobacterium oryzae TaxID=334852 RepID=UPI002F3055E0